MFWLTHFVKTAKTGKNRKPDENAIQPYLIRPYTATLIKEWRENRIIHVAKSRQMMMSWFCLSMLLWETQFYDYKQCIVINKALDDSLAGIDRVKLMYQNQPEWLKNLCLLDRKFQDLPRENITFANGSSILGLPQGAHKIRGLVPATALLDEAAYQDDLAQTYAACVPCSSRIVTVCSAGPGFFKQLCCE